MTRRQSKIDREITKWVNALTPAQYCELIQVIDPLTDEEREEFNAMSDDELLAQLRA